MPRHSAGDRGTTPLSGGRRSLSSPSGRPTAGRTERQTDRQPTLHRYLLLSTFSVPTPPVSFDNVLQYSKLPGVAPNCFSGNGGGCSLILLFSMVTKYANKMLNEIKRTAAAVTDRIHSCSVFSETVSLSVVLSLHIIIFRTVFVHVPYRLHMFLNQELISCRYSFLLLFFFLLGLPLSQSL